MTRSHLPSLGRFSPLTALAVLLSVTFSGWSGAAQASGLEELVLREGVMIHRVGRYGRAPLHVDAIGAEIAAGQWAAPVAGEEVELADGSTQAWFDVEAAENGWFQHRALGGGYLYVPVESDSDRVVLLEARGHSMVWVNGEPRGGDVYNTGRIILPVKLHAGTNDFLFHVHRGRVHAKLADPDAPITLSRRDATMPNLIRGERGPVWAAMLLINATGETLRDLSMTAAAGDGRAATTTLPPIAPFSTRKVGFQIGRGALPDEGPVDVVATLMRGETELDRDEFQLAVAEPTGDHTRTFISSIDGSVQYYAVRPALKPDNGDGPQPGVILTLHGAGVEGSGQRNQYAAKTWAHIVAPTNRRHFGFDWEDWGRLDALEVLEDAQARYGADPQRTWLTGHSMGGHGTWHLGVTFPDRFAAIGPSAGWISFWSYTGAERFEDANAVETIMRRATSPSDTLQLADNFKREGIYILHGSADDNVPVAQARTMAKHLAESHGDFVYREKVGAGHWWGGCCDWPPMMEYFQRHSLPARAEIRRVNFATASPGVSAWSDWAGIEAQHEPLAVSSIDISFDPKERRFAGTTKNVARLAIDLDHVPAGAPLSFEFDGDAIENVSSPAGVRRVWFTHDGSTWSSSGTPDPALKGPHRYGPFKEVFRNRMVFIYGTTGTDAENAWAFTKARFDAETFWYRGNGSIDVVADTDFDPAAEPDRNVVLYGNADTNLLWSALLADSPVQFASGAAAVGDREVIGTNLGGLFLQPRPGSDIALVGAVTGTGVAGMRLTDKLPYFVSGVAYPDCLLITPDTLTAGADGILAAGYFGNDWSIKTGDFAWTGDEE